MSDNENESSVLGKRVRNGEDTQNGGSGSPQPDGNVDQAVVAEEDSDDDVGPMPLPSGPENGGVKKKRKGEFHYDHSYPRVSQ